MITNDSSPADRATVRLGLIGLGRMGRAMARRMCDADLPIVGYDLDAGSRLAAEELGVPVVEELDELFSALDGAIRVIWMMVPAGVVPNLVKRLEPHLHSGDILVDGGNSHFRAAIERDQALAPRGVACLDVGTSGGVHGLERGYCLMVGGEVHACRTIEPYLHALSPGAKEASPGVPQGAKDASSAATQAADASLGASEFLGYLHCGPAGAGHFVKMVHNAIEYGMMSAYAEGFNLLSRAGLGRELAEQQHDAETTPVFNTDDYRYDFELDRIAEVWRRGSVVPSWLLDLTAEALSDDPKLEGLSEEVSDSGEGRWAVQAAVDLGVPHHVLSAALFDRFASRGQGRFAARIQSAMRLGFGGHGRKTNEK